MRPAFAGLSIASCLVAVRHSLSTRPDATRLARLAGGCLLGGLLLAGGCSREVGRSATTGTRLTQISFRGYADASQDILVSTYSSKAVHRPNQPVPIQVRLRNRSLTTPLRYRVRGANAVGEGEIVVDPPLIDVTAEGTAVGPDGKGMDYAWSWAASAGVPLPEAIDIPPNSERVIVDLVWRPPKDTTVHGAGFDVVIAGERYATGVSTEMFRR